jgi:putative transposase
MLRLHFIEPGKPNQNGHLKSFNGKFRDECLNLHWFTSLHHARQIIAAWKTFYMEGTRKNGRSGYSVTATLKSLAHERRRSRAMHVCFVALRKPLTGLLARAEPRE